MIGAIPAPLSHGSGTRLPSTLIAEAFSIAGKSFSIALSLTRTAVKALLLGATFIGALRHARRLLIHRAMIHETTLSAKVLTPVETEVSLPALPALTSVKTLSLGATFIGALSHAGRVWRHFHRALVHAAAALTAEVLTLMILSFCRTF